MAYSTSGYGFDKGLGGMSKKKESLVEIPTLKELSQLAAPEAIADEWGIMSCILASQNSDDIFLQVNSILEPKHFAFPLLRDVFRVMVQMHQDNLPVNYSVLQCVLQDTYEKNQDFFDEFMPKMYESAHDAEHVKIYAERILSKYHRRSLMSTFSEGISAAISHMNPEDALTQVERKLSEVRQEIHCKRGRKGSSLRSIMRNYVADLRGRLDGTIALNTIQTQSWYDFNNASQGFAPGDLIVIAAPTSCGKSMTGIGLAREFALGGHEVLYASLEMQFTEVAERIMSPLAGFSLTSMNRTGAITEEKINQIQEMVEKYESMPITIKKPGRNNYDSLLKSISEAEAERREELGDDFKGFRVVVVDYLQLLSADANPMVKVQEIDRITQLLRNYALENACTVIALAQYDTETSKSGKEPQNLNCLSYCKTIDHHATQVIMMYHPYFGDRNKIHEAPYIDYIWMKNRDGENGRVRLGVDWTKGWLFSMAHGKTNPEPAVQTSKNKDEAWEAIAAKYGTNVDKLKEAQQPAAALPETKDPLLALALPKGADVALVETMTAEYNDEVKEEEEVNVTEHNVVDVVSEQLPPDTLLEHESATDAEETDEAEEIEVNGEVYKVGEVVGFTPGIDPNDIVRVKIVQIENGRVDVAHTSTAHTKDHIRNTTGQQYRWKEGDIKTDVHIGRLSKL